MNVRHEISSIITKLEDIKEQLPEGRKIGSHWSDYDPMYFQHGDWECDESPTGMCMYTNRDYDSCIFCNDPDERK